MSRYRNSDDRQRPFLVLGAIALALIVPLIAGSRSSAEPARLEELRAAAGGLLSEQVLMGWATWTRGETSRLSMSYAGQESLFSPETVAFVREMADSAGNGDEARALRRLELHLAMEAVNLRTAVYDDERANVQASAPVTIEGRDAPIVFNQIDGLLANEADPDRRRALEAARTRIWDQRLNPILARKQAAEDSLIRTLGYADYVSFSRKLREIDLDGFFAEAFGFIRETHQLYESLLREQSRAVLGKDPLALRRADIARLQMSPDLLRFFPSELMVPSLRHFLSGMGLDLKAGGNEVRIDVDGRPVKNPRAACFPVSVPGDVRVSVKPVGGLTDFEAFFHECGHAVHFLNTGDVAWEFRHLGSAAATEGYAALFAGVWGSSAWLRHYRDFVVEQNRRGADHPVMTDGDIARVLRRRAFWTLYMVRRYAGARLLYETILHDGDPKITTPYYLRSANDDLQEVYRQIFSFAYGFDMTSEEALRFRSDGDPFLYAADYARGYTLSAALDEGLEAEFGDTWFSRPEAGQALRDRLFSHGLKLSSGEAAAAFGADSLSFTALKRLVFERFAESETLLESNRR